jgi:PAS domain S-box-containing protein
MSMRVKIVAILAASAAAIFLADAVIERLVVLPKFVALERREAELNLDRVTQAIDRELDQLARTTRNYGVWDDALQFLQTRSPEFVKSNLAPEAFATLRVNLVHYYDLEGKLVWGETRSASDGTPISIPDLNPSDFAPQTLLRATDAKPASLHGLLPVGDDLMLVASNPVLTSEGKGPARGTVVFGRLLTGRDQWRLREQTSVSFSLLTEASPGSRSRQTSGIGVRDNPNSGEFGYAAIPGDVAFDESRQDTLWASKWLSDVHGRPVRVLQVDLPRQITAQGRAVLVDEYLWMLFALLVFVLVVYWSFGRMVLAPVQQLIRHVLWIRQSGDLSNRIGSRSSDEVGTLAREFDLMLTQLARSQAARTRSEKQLKAVLHDHPDLIRRFTPDGTTTFVNRAYARYFGTTEERLIGKKEELPILDVDRAAVEAHVAALSTACPVTEVDHRVRLAGGEVRWLHWTTRAIFDPDGNVIEVQSVGRDVTRQKQAGSPDVPAVASPALPLVLNPATAAHPAGAGS